ncbi:MAG: ankyrin repeat domain-containing protein [Lentisphaeria bacterium]|nr:ankyrin repeat domain-containing protein [Lentisphaeria bacterium]
MKHLPPFLRLLAVCLLACAVVSGADRQGTVVEVLGKKVKVRFDEGQAPTSGATLQIGSTVPGVGFVPVEGTWRVKSVQGDVAQAESTAAGAGSPAPGMMVLVNAAAVAAAVPVTRVRRIPKGPPSKASLALSRAVPGRDAAKVAKLLAAGADPDYAEFGGWTVLMDACRRGTAEIVEKLLEAGADPNAATTEGKDAEHEGMTPLMAAAANNSKAVSLLLAAGAHVDARVLTGATALHFAARSGRLDAVEALIRAGVGVNVTTIARHGGPGGRSALHEATERGNTEAVAALIRAKANVNQALTGKAYSGFTPLRAAAHFGHLDIVKQLLAAGADPNAVTTGDFEKAWIGYTPLHAAVKQKHAEVVRALLAAKANPNITDARGQTALQLAERGKRQEIIKLLRLAAGR